MIRFAIAAVFALTVLPAPHAKASDAGHHCAPTAEIVQMAVTARKLGAEADATQADILANDAVEERYVPAVPSLVEWVYTLPEEQLTDEVAASFEEACGANIN
ncbi:DNA primase [Roseovarius sp. LXJ103]|uniref:DNA primase n=1 Tax=Roseovarius carneus TaxID=2853164 RepID=UPI000D60632B|nr:DNA primase [Roseovarius carneus]MBZ8118685.1 DNA primase [Roseovarius carneus]PWE35633.1 DNA primase [Pelagicola sp. LXJ1103]